MRRTIPIGLALALLTGCGPSLPPETNPAKGRDVLKSVLDGWAQGKSMNDLKAGRPSVVAYDPDWEAGHRLKKYAIDPKDSRSGVDLLVSVTLSLERPDGRPTEKTVNFCVAMGSQTVVTRKQ
jgi:hypothetical protein